MTDMPVASRLEFLQRSHVRGLGIAVSPRWQGRDSISMARLHPSPPRLPDRA
jgi:hypothetical protein